MNIAYKDSQIQKLFFFKNVILHKLSALAQLYNIIYLHLFRDEDWMQKKRSRKDWVEQNFLMSIL